MNLQRAHLMVNYDLPWNPNRIEQRFGRIHRIGQTEVCHLWNLVANDTREGEVFTRLLEKLEEQRKASAARSSTSSATRSRDNPLRDLLIEAIRYGDQPEVRAQLDVVIDATIGEGLEELMAERALHREVIAEGDVEEIRLRLEEAQARRLQPHFIESFFLEAFGRLGGRIEPPRGRPLRDHARSAGRPRPRPAPLGLAVLFLPRYQCVTFRRERVRGRSMPWHSSSVPGTRCLMRLLISRRAPPHESQAWCRPCRPH